VIRAVRPHVYVKGGDYTIETLDPSERAALQEVGAVVEIVALVPGKSTTAVVRKMSVEGAAKGAQ
jgi:bifunctional ADP-heptose synthase (sugar kinase/adenylyltransferase)